MTPSQDRTIHIFAKNSDEQIQIALNRYQDRVYVDMRVWYKSRYGRGFRPTKKGVCFPLDRLSDFTEGMNRLLETVKEMASPHSDEDEK